MKGGGGRVLIASGAVLAALAFAPAAHASPRVLVSNVSSLKAGATAGTLQGTVVNKTASARNAQVTVRLQRWGTKAPVVGRANVAVGANGSARFNVQVKLPSGLAR